MGFALWIEPEIAWAAGTYEYRPMGAAVIAISDLFRPRDFRRDLKPPPTSAPTFAGYFASLGHLNQVLEENRREPRPAYRR